MVSGLHVGAGSASGYQPLPDASVQLDTAASIHDGLAPAVAEEKLPATSLFTVATPVALLQTPVSALTQECLPITPQPYAWTASWFAAATRCAYP